MPTTIVPATKADIDAAWEKIAAHLAKLGIDAPDECGPEFGRQHDDLLQRDDVLMDLLVNLTVTFFRHTRQARETLAQQARANLRII
jgi:hypothetical protein